MHPNEFHSSSPYIPQEAYLFQPKLENNYLSEGKQREFFDGNIEFNAMEYQLIDKFRAYSIQQEYTLSPMWTDNMILRFLYANSFKLSKTLVNIKDYTVWRERELPMITFDEQLEKFLNSGVLYFHGRDYEFRPILIFNIYLVDPKKIDVEFVTKALTYWLEHVIREWMIPGKIESWILMLDVKGMGPSPFLLPSIRKLLTYLQDNYKCRLHSLYVLNVSQHLYAPWQIIKSSLDEITVQKIHIRKGQIPVGLSSFTNPEQMEQKHGGLAQNCTEFWPPVVPSNNYFIKSSEPEALITEEAFTTPAVTAESPGSQHIDTVNNEERPGDQMQPDQGSGDAIKLLSPTSSARSYPQTSVTPFFKVNDKVELGNDTDYLEYMNEEVGLTHRQAISRELRPFFLDKMAQRE